MKLLISLSLLFITIYSFGQNHVNQEVKYELAFEDVDQYEIKKIAGVLSPLFESSVKSNGTDHTSIYFISTKTVSKSSVSEALAENGLQFDFEFKATEL